VSRRLILLAWLGLAGCLGGCGDGGQDELADLAIGDDVPLCPPNVEQLMGAQCTYGVDRVCRGPITPECRCLCLGYWECDAVLAICHDMTVPGD
jgi:hypothetical protein